MTEPQEQRFHIGDRVRVKPEADGSEPIPNIGGTIRHVLEHPHGTYTVAWDDGGVDTWWDERLEPEATNDATE